MNIYFNLTCFGSIDLGPVIEHISKKLGNFILVYTDSYLVYRNMIAFMFDLVSCNLA